MNDFIEGALMMACAVVALFFLRFWRKTGDRLLGIFSLSFTLMAALRLVDVLARVPREQVHYVYLIRLLAYVLILYAVLDKNRSRT
jgi:Family of unknown function (DUF5985)